MLRAVAVVTLLAIGAPFVPLAAGHQVAHEQCPMAGDHCARMVAFTCCEAGEPPAATPAVASARTTVKSPDSVAAPPRTIVGPAPLAGRVTDETVAHAPPPRQRLTRLSVLRI